METEIQINTPSESVIAAYGKASWRRFLLPLLGAAAIVTSLLLLIGFFWLFAGRLFLPSRTVILGVATPHTVYTILQPSTRTNLPEPWQSAIETKSRWPMVFGASQNDEGWQFFVIAPRWNLNTRAPFVQQTSRLVRFISTTPPDSANRTTYLSWWGKTWRHPQAISQFELHPDSLVHEQTSSTDSLFGAIYRDHIDTNLITSALPSFSGALTGDLFLRLNPEATSTARDALLRSLRLSEEHSLLTTVQPSELRLGYSASGTISRLSFTAFEPMSSSTKLTLLGMLGFSKKSVVKLPDGSALIERRLPTEEELKTQSFYPLPHGSLQLTDTSYDLLYGPTSTLPSFTSCHSGEIIGRFSPPIVQQLLQALDLRFLPLQTGIQFYRSNDRLSVCLE